MRPFAIHFLLLSLFLADCRAFASDVSAFGILKSQQYVQTNTGLPVLAVSNAYAFTAFVFESTNATVSNATVQPPNTSLKSLSNRPSPASLTFVDRFNDSTSLDAAYPTTPQIVAFDSAQTIDTTRDFIVTWSYAGGNMNDLVQITVADANSNTVFASPSPGASNALSGVSNVFTIPALSLPPGTNLTAHLSIGKPAAINTNSYPGATGVSILGKDIQFPMVTRPAPVKPRLNIIAGHIPPFRFQFAAETNRNYHLQFSSNWSAWTDLLITNTTATNVNFADSNAPAAGRRFYRVQVGP